MVIFRYNVGMTEAFSDQLRLAVARSGFTLGELSRRTGIAPPVLCRFRKGQRYGLSMVSVDAVVEALELELVPRRPPGRRRPKQQK